VSPVEGREVDDDTTKQTTFAQSEEESDRQKSFIGRDESGTHRHDTPRCDQGRQIVTRTHLLEDKIGRYIDADVWNVEDGERDIELGSIELELGSKTVDSGVSNVGTVDERPQPETEEERHDVHIKLARDASVELGVDVYGVVPSCVCLFHGHIVSFFHVKGCADLVFRHFDRRVLLDKGGVIERMSAEKDSRQNRRSVLTTKADGEKRSRRYERENLGKKDLDN